MNWTERILDFPVRAAAVDDFLRDVRARGTGDLNAVLATFNKSGLCREALTFWTSREWIVVAELPVDRPARAGFRSGDVVPGLLRRARGGGDRRGGVERS